MENTSIDKVFDNDTKAHSKMLLRKMCLVSLDAVCFVVFVCIHKGLDFLATWVIPDGWSLVNNLFHVVFVIAFSLVYVRLAYGMVQIFVPAMRYRPKTGEPADIKIVDSIEGA